MKSFQGDRNLVPSAKVGEIFYRTQGGFFRPVGPPARLMFVNRVDIQEVSLDGSYTARLIKHLHNAIAIDFHYR